MRVFTVTPLLRRSIINLQKLLSHWTMMGGGGCLRNNVGDLRILIGKDDGLNDAMCHSDLQRQKAVSAYS